MAKIIQSFEGDTQEVERLRVEIKNALKQDAVNVKLWQPGIMYQRNKQWMTVIDFINEWKGQPVTFYSNLVSLRETACDLHYTNDMFISDHRLYENNQQCRTILSQLQPVTGSRKFNWEFMFGQYRPIKDELYEIFKKHPVANHTLHTYFRKQPDQGIWSNGSKPKIHTAETIDGNENAFENPVRHSDLIDLEVYNQSCYSVAIETVIHNDFAMFSEKEAKPIIAGRPFVIVGARHQLRAFRSLGFKTFSPVIDESYDDVEDIYERFNAVLDSMYQLTKQDPVEVYNKLRSVLEHNKKHFLENNWTKI